MWYRKQVKIQEVLTWQEFKHGTPYHVTLQASRPLDCCCKTSVMPLILKAQTLFFYQWQSLGLPCRCVQVIYPSPRAWSSSGRRTWKDPTISSINNFEVLEPPMLGNLYQFVSIDMNFGLRSPPNWWISGFTTWIIGTARSSWRLARNPLAPSRKMPKAPSLWTGATHIFRFCWTKQAVLL